jgi:Kdo2-lipid IVA lauroyltransferase/acyltransferase
LAKQRSNFRIEVEYLAARAVMASLAVGPRSFAFRLARVYVGLLDILVPKLRRVAERNLVLAFPDMDEARRWAIADGSFRSIARLLVTLARMPAMTRDSIGEWIGYDGLDYFREAKAGGNGVLFATAHMGNWELSAFAHGLLTEPMHVVVRPLDNPKIAAMVTGLRTMTGNHVIEKKDYARGILRALGRNEAVGILIDQNTSLDEGVFINFFGLQACTNPGFAKVAAHSGAAIIPGFALWNEAQQRYVLKFYPPFTATGHALEDTQRIHAQLEQVIREYPDQWLWIHRRWKTRPAGEKPIYS